MGFRKKKNGLRTRRLMLSGSQENERLFRGRVRDHAVGRPRVVSLSKGFLGYVPHVYLTVSFVSELMLYDASPQLYPSQLEKCSVHRNAVASVLGLVRWTLAHSAAPRLYGSMQETPKSLKALSR